MVFVRAGVLHCRTACITFEWFFVAVLLHVDFHLLFGLGTVAACLAHELLKVRMDGGHVRLEVLQPLKLAAALRTFVQLLKPFMLKNRGIRLFECASTNNNKIAIEPTLTTLMCTLKLF